MYNKPLGCSTSVVLATDSNDEEDVSEKPELSHDRVMSGHGCATSHWTGTDEFEVVEKVRFVGIN